MNKQAVAKAPGFVLKMRLVAPNGMPFKFRLFRVEWGGKLHPPAAMPPLQTDGQGALSILLDKIPVTAPSGELRVVSREGGKETILWSIQLLVPDDTPLSTMPAIEPAPQEPDPTSASPDEIVDYTDQMDRYRARVVNEVKEHRIDFFREWDEVAPMVTFLRNKPSLTELDRDIYEAWRQLMLAYAFVLNGYEASWRLWNLADLPLDDEPTLPFLAADFQKLLRALDCFGLRFDLPPLVLRDDGPPEALPAYLEKLKQVHDKRGPLVP